MGEWLTRTILTGDIVGFSSKLRQDQEALIDFLIDFYAQVDAIVTRLGGVLFRKEGDCIWCSFEHPANCLRAVVALLELCPRQNDAPSGAVRLRYGAHIGRVRITPAGDILGHTLSVAKRLQEAAPPEGVAMTSELFQELEGQPCKLDFGPPGMVELKGVGSRQAYFGKLPPTHRAELMAEERPLSYTPSWTELMEPSLYPLKLVQAAYQGQATQVNWSITRDAFELTVDSTDLNAVHLLKLREWVHDGPSKRELNDLPDTLRDLIMSLRGAHAEKPFCVEWSRWDRKHSSSLQFFATGEERMSETSRFPRSIPEGCRLTVRRQPDRSLLASLGRSRRSLDHAALEYRAAERCRFAPLRIRFDGRHLFSPTVEQFSPDGYLEDILSLSVSKRFSLVERYLVPRAAHADLLMAPAPSERPATIYYLGGLSSLPPSPPGTGGKSFIVQVERPGNLDLSSGLVVSKSRLPHLSFELPALDQNHPLACFAILTIPASLSGPGRVVFVKSGVLMKSKIVDLGCPGAVAIVSASGLTCDPARFEILEDRQFHLRILWLKQHFEEMLAAFWEDSRKLPKPLAEFARKRLS